VSAAASAARGRGERTQKGDKKSLLVNSTDICRQLHKATVNFAAHNGATLQSHPLLENEKCPGKRGRKGKRGGRNGPR
jgi:hypothetical protein